MRNNKGETEMKVLNLQFLQGMKAVLDKLEDGSSYTREQICTKLGLAKEWAPAVSLAMMDEMFVDYEMVKSRGIRRVNQERRINSVRPPKNNSLPSNSKVC
jgi:hypothetical protein